MCEPSDILLFLCCEWLILGVIGVVSQVGNIPHLLRYDHTVVHNIARLALVLENIAGNEAGDVLQGRCPLGFHSSVAVEVLCASPWIARIRRAPGSGPPGFIGLVEPSVLSPATGV